MFTSEEMELLKRLGMSKEDVEKKLVKTKGAGKKAATAKVAQVYEYNLIRIEHCNLCKTVEHKFYWMRKDFKEGQHAPYLKATEISQEAIEDNGLPPRKENVNYPTCKFCFEVLMKTWEKETILKELLRRKNGC